MREATDQQGELLLFRNPISGALDWVRDMLENKAPTLWKASGNPHFLCHQGDWESLSLELDPADLLGPPRGLVLFQHGKPSPVAWKEVEKVEETRAPACTARGEVTRRSRGRPIRRPVTGAGPDERWSTWTGEWRTRRERPRAGEVVRVRRGVGGSRQHERPHGTARPHDLEEPVSGLSRNPCADGREGRLPVTVDSSPTGCPNTSWAAKRRPAPLSQLW